MLRNVLAVAICVILASTAVCVATYRIQRRRLRQWVREVVADEPYGKEAVLALARFVFSSIKRTRDPIFLTRILRAFGGSPLAILRNGGCCSGIHRLFIASLDAIGIPAAQVTLYHHSGAWCHCLAQVSLDRREWLIDVDYGLQYLDESGAPLGLRDLRGGVQPSIRVFAAGLEAPICDGYVRDSRPGYPHSVYYDFDFKQTRTANWTRSLARRLAYRLLGRLSRGRIDCVLVSPVLEWPQMILAVCLSAMALVLLVARQTL